LGGLGSSSKARLTRHWLRLAPPSPRENAEIHADLLAYEMPLLGKQFLHWHAEDFGKEFDLFAGRGTAERFDVRQNFARHVDATDQMQFGHEIHLRPATLIPQIRDLSSDDICVSHPPSEGQFKLIALNRNSHKMGRAR
jgi:hypothetical protein